MRGDERRERREGEVMRGERERCMMREEEGER